MRWSEWVEAYRVKLAAAWLSLYFVLDEHEGRAHRFGRRRNTAPVPASLSGVAVIVAKRMGESHQNTKKAMQRLEGGTVPRDGLLVAHLAHFYGMDVAEALEAAARARRSQWPPAHVFVSDALERLEQYKTDVSRQPGKRDTDAGKPGCAAWMAARTTSSVPSLEARDTQSSTCPAQLENLDEDDGAYASEARLRRMEGYGFDEAESPEDYEGGEP